MNKLINNTKYNPAIFKKLIKMTKDKITVSTIKMKIGRK